MAKKSQVFGFSWVLERFAATRTSEPGPVVITPEKLEPVISEQTARAFENGGHLRPTSLEPRDPVAEEMVKGTAISPRIARAFMGGGQLTPASLHPHDAGAEEVVKGTTISPTTARAFIGGGSKADQKARKNRLISPPQPPL